MLGAQALISAHTIDFVLRMPHTLHMKRRLNRLEMNQWREQVGGLDEASLLIKGTLDCSLSKAQKLASGRYPSEISASEQSALAALLKRPRDVLFPETEKARRSKAS